MCVIEVWVDLTNLNRTVFTENTTATDSTHAILPSLIQDEYKEQLGTLERKHSELQSQAEEQIKSLETVIQELRSSVESASESSHEKAAMLSEEIMVLKGKVRKGRVVLACEK